MADYSMLFKKVSFGCKFNLKKYQKDAELFNLIRHQLCQKLDNISSEGIPVKRKQRNEDNENIKIKKTNDRTDLGIQVFGNDVPDIITVFTQSSIRIPKYLKESMILNNFVNPTPIQMQTIPIMINNRNILACAPTGSGKTFAYLFPLLLTIKSKKIKNLFAVIVLPTKELARQIYNEISLISKESKLKVSITSKTSSSKSKNIETSHIIVSTPQRMADIINNSKIDLKNLPWLILDEGDLLFCDGKKGFKNQISIIYNACSETTRVGIFSATVDSSVENWLDVHIDNPIKVLIGNQTCPPESITQRLVFVGQEAGKILAIRNLIHSSLEPPILVFVNSIERAKDLFNELLFDGVSVDMIHADKTETQRTTAVNAFRTGKTWILITTDLMSRGIDFKGIKQVINFDPPTSMVNYVHRIGRTGRAGIPGTAITFFTEKDIPYIKLIVPILKASNVEYPSYLDK